MKTPLAARIALRYLLARKSHSAVTAISAVSICGIAVATAAIVCVLSVFNGFMDVLAERNDTLASDVVITPAHGKVFADTDSLMRIVQGVPGVETAMPVVADNALVICQGREMPVMLKGVDRDAYRRLTAIERITLPGGRFSTVDSATMKPRRVYDEDIGDFVELPAAPRYAADISIGVASRLEAAPGGNDALLVFAPRRKGYVNPANPAASFLQDSIIVTGVFRAMQNDYDDNYVITDIALARDIFEYDDQCTSVEVKAAPGTDPATLAHDLRASLSSRASVRDRWQQQALNFRMIQIEKWVTFMLLAFILVVASFNIISTLSMLVLDKQPSLGTLHALGFSRGRIGAIFAWESIYVTMAGCVAGMLLGVALCLAQQHSGFIKLAGDPSTLVIRAYPVKVVPSDLLTVLLPVLLIGAVTALIANRFAKSRV